jgi:hypothetical protein
MNKRTRACYELLPPSCKKEEEEEEAQAQEQEQAHEQEE